MTFSLEEVIWLCFGALGLGWLVRDWMHRHYRKLVEDAVHELSQENKRLQTLQRAAQREESDD